MKNGKSKWKIVLIVILILIGTNVATFFAANYISFKTPNGKVLVSRNTYENVLSFEKLINIKEKLDRYYLGDYDINALIDGAAKGMTEAVGDPYTTYMNAEEFKDFYSQTEGNYVGLGIQVGVKDDKVCLLYTSRCV